MGAGVKILIGVVVAIIAIGAIAYFTLFSASADTPAFLYVDEGTVDVNTGSGWTKAINEMTLSQGASVRTGADGRATIVLHESEMVRLEPNSNVSIKDLSKDKLAVSQSSGKTVSQIRKLTGVTDFSVETPDTVATVRGTGFAVFVEEDGTEVLVDEGVVGVGDKEVKANKKLHAMKGKLGDILELDDDDRAFLGRQREFDVKHLQQLRMRILHKNKAFNAARKIYKFNDDQLREGFEKVDRGELNEDELIAKYGEQAKKFPGVERDVDRIRKINAMIRERMKK